MTLRECEEKLKELNTAEDEIILYGYAHIDGEKLKNEDLSKLTLLKEKYTKLKDEIISKPLTIADCSRMIKLCIEAEESVLAGKEYELEGRKLVRADLAEILRLKTYYQKEKERLEQGLSTGSRIRSIIPTGF
ncbi:MULTISPECIES: hypothetical protein [Fusobacterium]|uniref:Uncharacterized protein n=1 Tax=Fusobacterium ulcerans 12-1B TaxID=457404 RepID=H1PQJ4_9FUSO|nr:MULTISPECIES: hypothetical protein [Fusobacterium]EHO83669.1 hypothetical protein HMPREF0402_00687 [Fusobacterium ulcerans 12-1B]